MDDLAARREIRATPELVPGLRSSLGPAQRHRGSAAGPPPGSAGVPPASGSAARQLR
jgi:hypothetical protein